MFLTKVIGRRKERHPLVTYTLNIPIFMGYFHYSTSQITQSMAVSEDNSITAIDKSAITSTGVLCGLGLLLEPLGCDVF